MPDHFDLPVTYHGEELSFPSELFPSGYTHKIKVMVNEIEVFFEPDDERNYRAVVNFDQIDTANKIKPGLLKAISETLHELFA